MAKPTGPLLSLEAHGQIGKALIFSKRKSGQMVRQYHKPSGAPSAAQITQREVMAQLTANWHEFTSEEKLVYNNMAAASGGAISGFNLYVRLAQVDIYRYYGIYFYGET